MLTPLQIQKLADPVEGIYITMVNELMRNIVRHITSPTWTHTAAWEIQKLSELGQLTRENAEIINRHIKEIPQELRASMEETRRITLGQIEGQMEKAAKEGFLTPPSRDSTIEKLVELERQAEDRLNLTNTTMLQSSLDYYTDAILQTAQTVQQAQEESTRLINQTKASMEILNQAAADVAVSTRTQRNAVAGAIRDLSDRGITGFVDRAGRNWSAEAYVNMVVRTTVHNTAIESVRSRMADYGTDVFQISAHAGARPLCEPYQGWFCSWNGGYGEIELGDGSTVEYVPLDDTSYGEPAGIFGVNCGHDPIPMIEGVSIPTAQDNIQDKEENDKLYQETQEQRRLEREIREAKRNVELLGDLATKKDLDKVKEAQAAMREFINRTGLTRRPEREQIYTKAPSTPQKEQTAPQKQQATSPTVQKENPQQQQGTISRDVTNQYIDKATPGTGSVSFGDGFDMERHQAEVEVANWLLDTFGGDILVQNESTEEGVKTADYLWNGKLWDLKNTSTEKAADSAIRHGLKQIQENPGGLILDYGKNNVAIENAEKVIDGRMRRGFQDKIDIMIRKDGDLVKVLRYKK